MFKLFALFATPALALAATAGIAGEPTKSFTHDGVTYRYDATTARNGSTVLTGVASPGAVRFRLVVRDGRVTGHADNRPVSFSVAAAKGALARPERGVRVASAD